jgi:hypothetical protein
LVFQEPFFMSGLYPYPFKFENAVNQLLLLNCSRSIAFMVAIFE